MLSQRDKSSPCQRQSFSLVFRLCIYYCAAWHEESNPEWDGTKLLGLLQRSYLGKAFPARGRLGLESGLLSLSSFCLREVYLLFTRRVKLEWSHTYPWSKVEFGF